MFSKCFCTPPFSLISRIQAVTTLFDNMVHSKQTVPLTDCMWVAAFSTEPAKNHRATCKYAQKPNTMIRPWFNSMRAVKSTPHSLATTVVNT